MQDMNSVKHIMMTMGWTEPFIADHVILGPILFKPEVFKPGVAWEQEIATMKQVISDQRIVNRSNNSKENNQE